MLGGTSLSSATSGYKFSFPPLMHQAANSTLPPVERSVQQVPCQGTGLSSVPHQPPTQTAPLTTCRNTRRVKFAPGGDCIPLCCCWSRES